MMSLTVEDISRQTGLSRQTISKRRGAMQFYIDDSVISGGRPKLLFKPDVLRLFGIQPVAEPVIKKSRGQHTSAGIPRKPSGLSADERIKIEQSIVAYAKGLFLSQALRDNVLPCVKDSCALWIHQNGLPNGFKDLDTMAWYYYNDRIMRKDGSYVGKYHTENWFREWERLHDVRQTNALAPKNRWDYVELLSNIGELGAGCGAGAFWAMDATQLDVWVIGADGKPHMCMFYQIMDVVTGFPLWIELIESESIESCLRTIAKAVDVYGLPKWGIIMDNGSAFKSKYTQGFMTLLYSPEHLAMLEETSWRKRIFSGQTGVCLYPGAMKPTFYGKAKLEQSFNQINRGMGRLMPATYQPPRDKSQTSYNLGSTPTQKMKKALPEKDVWNTLVWYIYEQYALSPKRDALKTFNQKTGLSPTPADAFRYYGGLFDESQSGLIRYESALQTSKALGMVNKILPDKTNVPGLVYYFTPIAKKHIITVSTYRGAQVIHEGVSRNYMCDELGDTFMDRKICVIPDPSDNNEAYLYLEYNKNWYDARTPEEGSVYYIGKAYDYTVRKEADFHFIEERRKLQNTVGNKDAKNIEISNGANLLPEADYSEYKIIGEIENTAPDYDDDDPFDPRIR